MSVFYNIVILALGAIISKTQSETMGVGSDVEVIISVSASAAALARGPCTIYYR